MDLPCAPVLAGGVRKVPHCSKGELALPPWRLRLGVILDKAFKFNSEILEFENNI